MEILYIEDYALMNYFESHPVEDIIEAYNNLSQVYDTYILSTELKRKNSNAWQDKQDKMLKNRLNKEAYKELILSHNKNLNRGNYLIYRRLNSDAYKFSGKHIQLDTEKFPDWKSILNFFKEEIDRNRKRIYSHLTYEDKILILMNVGNETLPKKELIKVVGFDQEIGGSLYSLWKGEKSDFAYVFKSKEEKVFLFKGLMLLAKLCNSNLILRQFEMGSVSAHIWLYYIIGHENPELRTPELEDWIYNIKMLYHPMGVPLGSPLKDDVY